MQALNNLGIDLKLVIVQIINFGILLFLLTKFLYRPILNTLDSRKKRIEESLKKADEVDQMAATAAEEHEKQMKRAKKEAAQIIEEAQSVALQEKKKIVEAAHAEAELIKANGKLELERERRTLESGIKKNVGKLTLTILTKVLKTGHDEAYFEKSVTKALEEIKD